MPYPSKTFKTQKRTQDKCLKASLAHKMFRLRRALRCAYEPIFGVSSPLRLTCGYSYCSMSCPSNRPASNQVGPNCNTTTLKKYSGNQEQHHCLFDLVEPEGTERGCSWPFVPFLDKKSCLGPSRMLGLASLISTNDNLLHMPRHSNSVFVREMCPPPSSVMSISIKQYFICARSVGPFGPPEEEKGVIRVCLNFISSALERLERLERNIT